MSDQISPTSAIEKYDRRADAVNSLLCVGLDSAIERLPERFRSAEQPQFAFNRWIIEQTHPYVSAYKPNIAFYEARGDQGLRDLKLTLDYLRANHPDILTICDAKRGDNSTSNAGYVSGIFDWLGFDAVTLQPYMGSKALAAVSPARAIRAASSSAAPRTPATSELQCLLVEGKPLWQVVAERVRDQWNANGNCMLVVGATVPDELRQIRALVGDMTAARAGHRRAGWQRRSSGESGHQQHRQRLDHQCVALGDLRRRSGCRSAQPARRDQPVPLNQMRRIDDRPQTLTPAMTSPPRRLREGSRAPLRATGFARNILFDQIDQRYSHDPHPYEPSPRTRRYRRWRCQLMGVLGEA